jgi:cbb3-type cytochrome oxidase subunit 3
MLLFIPAITLACMSVVLLLAIWFINRKRRNEKGENC